MKKIWNLAVFKNNVRVGLETFDLGMPCMERLAHWRVTYTAKEKVPATTKEIDVEIEGCWVNRAQRVTILVYTVLNMEPVMTEWTRESDARWSRAEAKSDFATGWGRTEDDYNG